MNRVLGDRRAIVHPPRPGAARLHRSSCWSRSSGPSATPSSRATRSAGSRSSASTTSQQLFTDPDVRDALWFTLKYAVVLTDRPGRARLRAGAAVRLLCCARPPASSAPSCSSRSSCRPSRSRCCSSSSSSSRPRTGLVNAAPRTSSASRSVDWFASPRQRLRRHHPHGPLAVDGLLRRAALRRPGRHPRGDARVRPARRRIRAPARPAHRASRCRCPCCSRRSSSASTAR